MGNLNSNASIATAIIEVIKSIKESDIKQPLIETEMKQFLNEKHCQSVDTIMPDQIDTSIGQLNNLFANLTNQQSARSFLRTNAEKRKLITLIEKLKQIRGDQSYNVKIQVIDALYYLAYRYAYASPEKSEAIKTKYLFKNLDACAEGAAEELSRLKADLICADDLKAIIVKLKKEHMNQMALFFLRTYPLRVGDRASVIINQGHETHDAVALFNCVAEDYGLCQERPNVFVLDFNKIEQEHQGYVHRWEQFVKEHFFNGEFWQVMVDQIFAEPEDNRVFRLVKLPSGIDEENPNNEQTLFTQIQEDNQSLRLKY